MSDSLGTFIRDRRQELGLTQEQLADRIGDTVRQAEVSRLEGDRISLPHRTRLVAIAAALDVSLGELLVRSGWMEEGDDLAALEATAEDRGSGTADALVEAGLHWAAGRGFDRVQLYVTATNVPAKRFYARSGFCPLQEIWARDLDRSPVQPPPDPACEAGYAHGHHLLATSHHRLVDGEMPCPPYPL